ncbi:MAG TPA: amylo-alpha-1,6-glucosidase, partial [Acidobacteriota bacterium]|nr:amylo-alpha-1,6-glucosidase [Acidobacteriota bacterium]
PLAVQMLKRQQQTFTKEGQLSNRFPHADLGCADGLGWMALRTMRVLEKTKTEHYFSKDELVTLRKKLVDAVHTLEAKRHDGLIKNGPLETWMDTGMPQGDVRAGARIEIQALYIAHLTLIKKINTILADKQYEFITEQKERFVKHVKAKLFTTVLHDGKNPDGTLDYTIRPNIFLAYYIAPELLTQKEWEQTFDSALTHLWMPWGGLSSIDKNHPLFTKNYTGQTNVSYHRGDSWFFVNALAALALWNLQPKKYSKYIKDILLSCTNGIVSQGAVGSLAEVSSAQSQTADGCVTQAWSLALFIEAMSGIFKEAPQ